MDGLSLFDDVHNSLRFISMPRRIEKKTKENKKNEIQTIHRTVEDPTIRESANETVGELHFKRGLSDNDNIYKSLKLI